tara:strand:- start:357 stop:581 length:225 start_codon:yes stop_codon:yes gene_type:complete
MKTMRSLINLAVANNDVFYAAQERIFFADMNDLIAKLESEGCKTQQNDGDRVLVDHKAWVTRHGVIYPIRNNSV